ncbi:plasma membrane heat shock protein [Scheffersomyces stipitis CBS 6054]|uniref:Plasma membrane heat shock protein n=1 Tax=Scheffersomyces stipitis (strain ATCC 58785 / CBS 6054 / NBRC 10063 / NRRL Y-11545) TaxID=322104 RepID=A3LUH9_PICST|nr:plasma membrane heat shock protein [Scheffersomyces stipitis CBS 6054]ABN66594.2 plasma membrane heat shock protein [Scheffersomyces stipitis CBS 6054]KAG2732689.1 hypothetical protein G9P44_003679 [Scheffersomyces stipitis]
MTSLTHLVSRANQAIEVNPPAANIDIHLTSHGSNWLWALFSVFSLFAVVHAFVYGFTSSEKKSLKKTLLVIPLFINAVMAYTYFTYASNLGWTSTPTEFQHVTTSEDLDVRQIFYVKWVGYFLTWPLVLTIIEVTTQSTDFFEEGDILTKFFSLFSRLFAKILATEVFVIGLLIGALIESTYKWGYFTFSVTAQLFAEIYIFVNVMTAWRQSTQKLGLILVLCQLVIWILYPIAWGLSEGGNKIQPDSEAAFYGVLDFFTFFFIPVGLTWLAINNVDEEFFSKVWHLQLRKNTTSPAPDAEKDFGETPRHSGDTAVAPVGVPTDEQ